MCTHSKINYKASFTFTLSSFLASLKLKQDRQIRTHALRKEKETFFKLHNNGRGSRNLTASMLVG